MIPCARARFMLRNLVDPVDLCKHCLRLFCRKAQTMKKDFPDNKMEGCPSYHGNPRWKDHNLKHVSREDFEKYGNEGFQEARRIIE